MISTHPGTCLCCSAISTTPSAPASAIPASASTPGSRTAGGRGEHGSDEIRAGPRTARASAPDPATRATDPGRPRASRPSRRASPALARSPVPKPPTRPTTTSAARPDQRAGSGLRPRSSRARRPLLPPPADRAANQRTCATARYELGVRLAHAIRTPRDLSVSWTWAGACSLAAFYQVAPGSPPTAPPPGRTEPRRDGPGDGGPPFSLPRRFWRERTAGIGE